jgi:hypothetical protein
MLKKICVTGIVSSLAVASAFFAVPAFAQGPGNGHHGEKHPIIRRSINQLDHVEKELAKADNDFHGHKEKARELIRQAIGELKLAIASDRH